MLRKDATVKVGIYTSGAHVRVIGECDLITQESGNSDPAIYLVEVCVMRDPRNEFTVAEKSKLIQSMKRNFETKQFQFKAKNREDADIFIKSKISDNWEIVRELVEV